MKTLIKKALDEAKDNPPFKIYVRPGPKQGSKWNPDRPRAVKKTKKKAKKKTKAKKRVVRIKNKIRKLEGKPPIGTRDPRKASIYSAILAELICTRLANGESLRKICATEGFPSPSTILEWAKYPDELLRPGFQDQYIKAKTIGYHMMADEIIEIADDSGKDRIKKTLPSGKVIEVIDRDNIQRDKLRVESRFKIISKTLPEYADKVQVEHTGTIDLVGRLANARKRVIITPELQNTDQKVIEGVAEEVV